MKKQWWLALALALVLTLTCTAAALAADINMKLTVDEDIAQVSIGSSSYTSSQNNISIPDTVLKGGKLYIYVTLKEDLTEDKELKASYGSTSVTPVYIADGDKYQIEVNPQSGAELKLSTWLKIDQVEMTVDAPVIGSYPNFAVEIPGGRFYTVTSVYWKQNETRLTASSKFAAELPYTLVVTLAPDSGYCFPEGTGALYSGKVLINGEEITDESLKAIVKAAGLELSYTWSQAREPIAPPKKPEQMAAQTVAVGDEVKFTVEAEGENLHYQWYKKGDPTDEKVGTDSPTLDLGAATAAMDGLYYCVVSNEADEVATDPVRLTVSSYFFPFVDVKSGDWYYDDVVYANRIGLIDGRTPTTFAPFENMTYAEAIKLAACMHQLYTTGEVTLTNGSPWYQTYVDYAKEHDIPWSFRNYNAPVTRADYVYIFYYALPESSYTPINTVTTLPDVTSSTDHSREIFTFYRAGILEGINAQGSFAPKTQITRREVVAILTRMMDPTTRKTLSL